MPQELVLRVRPEEAHDEVGLLRLVSQRLGRSPRSISEIHVRKRSIDARQRQVLYNVSLVVYGQGEAIPSLVPQRPDYPNVQGAPEVIVVGAGPAGLFAALELIELGIKPIVIERGKDVQGRRRDLKAITIHHKVDSDSNYCFGEGGAGTYSDGKLYTRSKKRGDVQRVMDLLVAFGASPDILVDAHPHIGTNKLPKIIEQMRETIRQQGGEVRFETRMTEVLVEAGRAVGIRCQTGEELRAEAVLLATGHSARDVFRLLHQQGIYWRPNPLRLGCVLSIHSRQLIESNTAVKRVEHSCPPRPTAWSSRWTAEGCIPSACVREGSSPLVLPNRKRSLPMGGPHPNGTKPRPTRGLSWSCAWRTLLPSRITALLQGSNSKPRLSGKRGSLLEKPKRCPCSV